MIKKIKIDWLSIDDITTNYFTKLFQQQKFFTLRILIVNLTIFISDIMIETNTILQKCVKVCLLCRKNIKIKKKHKQILKTT